MGFCKNILLTVEPMAKKFYCRKGDNKRFSDIGSSRAALHKRQRIKLVRECLQSKNATEVRAKSIHEDNMIQEIILHIIIFCVYLLLLKRLEGFIFHLR